MILPALGLFGGVIGLYLGAHWLVFGAAGLGRTIGARPIVVGLTVVSLGTSAPELVVCVLAASVLIAIPLGFGTTLEVYDLPPPGAAAVLAGAGAAGLWYGLRQDARPLVLCSCATIVSAAWYLGVDAGERLGTVLALAFTAALFFWVATRLGRGKEA